MDNVDSMRQTTESLDCYFAAHRNGRIDKDQPTLQCSYRRWCDILMWIIINRKPVKEECANVFLPSFRFSLIDQSLQRRLRNVLFKIAQCVTLCLSATCSRRWHVDVLRGASIKFLILCKQVEAMECVPASWTKGNDKKRMKLFSWRRRERRQPNAKHAQMHTEYIKKCGRIRWMVMANETSQLSLAHTHTLTNAASKQVLFGIASDAIKRIT